MNYYRILFWFVFIYSCAFAQDDEQGLVIGEFGYFEMPGLNVLVYNCTFLQAHQSSVEIIHHVNRVAANGELRLSASPGQWQPIPQWGAGYKAQGVSPQDIGLKSRTVDKDNNTISGFGWFGATAGKVLNKVACPEFDQKNYGIFCYTDNDIVIIPVK